MIPVERLRQIPLFAPLDLETVAQIAPLFHRMRYKLGDVIFAQGAPGDAFYILEVGTLRVRRVDAHGQEHVIDYYQAPRHFGETSLLTGLYHDAALDVFSETAELFVLSKDEWDVLLNEHPDIKEQLNIRAEIQRKLSARTFKWLTEGEYVVVHTRRHPFALIWILRLPAIVAGGLLFLAVLTMILNSGTAGAVAPLATVSMILWIVSALWILGSFGWMILDWSNDYFIVTNKRVIHIEKVAALFDEREEAPIDQVTNVNESAQSIAARVFDYCDIRVETAGHLIDINFSYVPRRLRVRQNIFEEIERVRSRSQFEKREQLRAEIREELQKYIHPPQAGAQVAAPAAPPMLRAAMPAPLPIRQRRRSGLGKRLNEMLGLQIEEQGRITWRKHWLDLFSRTAKWIGILGLSLVIGPAILVATWQQSSELARLLFGAIGFIAVNGAGFLVWYHYEDWRNDVYQLTDERILDIERSPFRFKEHLVETTLERIQNVSYNKPTLLANLLNYGDLMIETAGGQGQLVFKNIPSPQRATQEIFRRRDAYRERQQHDQVRRNQTDFLDWFLEYHRLLQQKGDVGVPPATRSAPPPDAAPSDEEPPA